METSENIIPVDPPVIVPDPLPNPIPEVKPEPAAGDTVSDNKPEEPINNEKDKTVSENIQSTQVVKENYTYNSVIEEISVSHNVIVDPNDLISVNSVSMNLISADGLSLNSVSVNVSNNYISNNTTQIISADSTPFWDKPFTEYTTSEGLLFIIMVSLVLGFVSTHLLRGLKHYGNI